MKECTSVSFGRNGGYVWMIVMMGWIHGSDILMILSWVLGCVVMVVRIGCS